MLSEINGMATEDFVTAFGDVAEHSTWVAQQAAAARPFASRDAMVAAFANALYGATHEMQLSLIRAHPDLATRTKLTTDSTREQAGAGLDTLTPAEFARFTELNDLHKKRFDFPFIFAVKGATKHQILAGFMERIDHPVEREFAITLEQICRIFRFRIEDRVAP
jgi:2-oxo-4-hydroxy-4-carboxy-5-ureidoimidazoline decarboxylase